MVTEPRECGAEIGPGLKCQELAPVKGMRHIYQKRESESGLTDHVLIETHYDIACPKCGTRTLVQKHDLN